MVVTDIFFSDWLRLFEYLSSNTTYCQKWGNFCSHFWKIQNHTQQSMPDFKYTCGKSDTHRLFHFCIFEGKIYCLQNACFASIVELNCKIAIRNVTSCTEHKRPLRVSILASKSPKISQNPICGQKSVILPPILYRLYNGANYITILTSSSQVSLLSNKPPQPIVISWNMFCNLTNISHLADLET